MTTAAQTPVLITVQRFREAIAPLNPESTGSCGGLKGTEAPYYAWGRFIAEKGYPCPTIIRWTEQGKISLESDHGFGVILELPATEENLQKVLQEIPKYMECFHQHAGEYYRKGRDFVKFYRSLRGFTD